MVCPKGTMLMHNHGCDFDLDLLPHGDVMLVFKIMLIWNVPLALDGSLHDCLGNVCLTWT